MTNTARSFAFTDGLSRRARPDDALAGEEIFLLDPHELPSSWTPEHVAGRLVAGFETLRRLGGAIGPRQHANGWPAMLQEFSDLIDEEAMANARHAFVKARSRPSADDISMMDEALAWPMQHLSEQPLLGDAALVWAFCKAGKFSMAGLLRARTAWAKELAKTREVMENQRRAEEMARARSAILRWAERQRDERRIVERVGDDQAEALKRLRAAAWAREADARTEFAPVKVAPHEMMPGKVLSRASLDRYLPLALRTISDCLNSTLVAVR